MAQTLEPANLAGLAAGEDGAVLSGLLERGTRAVVPGPVACAHCGEPCHALPGRARDLAFCCLGCEAVHTLLSDHGLEAFYQMSDRPGRRVQGVPRPGRWSFLDDPSVRVRLLDFEDERTARVTFHLPAIHCVACVWLLENLFCLHSGIGSCRVHFPRREAAITFSPERLSLGELAALLDQIGYEPALSLAELEAPRASPDRRMALRIGVAGFAFGNIMLLSLPLYFGMDSFSRARFPAFFGLASLLLALPTLVYSASDYWKTAWASLRQRRLTLDVPIALGLAALFLQSAWEIIGNRGAGYLDSLSGLIFFLLCGRAFQQKTHDRLGFDRDYRCFFPLAVVRCTPAGEETVTMGQVAVGDRLIVRHGELIPADGQLLSEQALVDYSFVTGEADLVTRRTGERLYAGGRQMGAAIEVETVKPVSESYLTSLWNDPAFQKNRDDSFATLTNRYSRRFTLLVIALALGAGVGWLASGDLARGVKAFTSVLIVACPCALALAAPFTLGTAQRLLSRRSVFLRNAQVIEALAGIDTVALDKTGTLTASASWRVEFHGSDPSEAELACLASLCRQSTHPLARRLATLAGASARTLPVRKFEEEPGRGMRGTVEGRAVVAGSSTWLAEQGIAIGGDGEAEGSRVFVGMDGVYRGCLIIENRLRVDVEEFLRELGRRFEVVLLSGDRDRERPRFGALLGQKARLHFGMSPQDKLEFVRELQGAGRRVLMAGDGLNDAGALRQADVGVAVVEGVGGFSPASDVILDAPMVARLVEIVEFSRRATRVVRFGFAVSAIYNTVGIAIAAAGLLSPVVCAVLMPVSSASVISLAIAATYLAAAKLGLAGRSAGLATGRGGESTGTR